MRVGERLLFTRVSRMAPGPMQVDPKQLPTAAAAAVASA